jgi:peptidyl-prolyl cis-trans isomerase B (cyclophilin B)
MTKRATFETNRGTIVAELYDAEAPKTVANFEKLANAGFYDGVKFHRVIPEFVIQGGDPYSKGGEHAKGPVGTGGPGYTIPDELVGNPHRHVDGALSMAHAGANTGGSQFFIVLSERNTRHLDWRAHGVREGDRRHGRGPPDQGQRRHDHRARRLTARIRPTRTGA